MSFESQQNVKLVVKVIYCNMKQTPYYEISPVKPDVLLKDFVAIFHPELVEADYQPSFYYLLEK